MITWVALNFSEKTKLVNSSNGGKNKLRLESECVYIEEVDLFRLRISYGEKYGYSNIKILVRKILWYRFFVF